MWGEEGVRKMKWGVRTETQIARITRAGRLKVKRGETESDLAPITASVPSPCVLTSPIHTRSDGHGRASGTT